MVGDINRVTFRSQTTEALYAWELERERNNWRVTVVVAIAGAWGTISRRHAERGASTPW